MRTIRVQKLAEWSGGYLHQGDPLLQVKRVHTDTRSIQAGDLFVALKGDRFDGHEYVHQAAERGAVAAMVSHPLTSDFPKPFGLMEVADTLAGLQALAKNYRDQLSVSTIGVTGSSGKTSTKELISAVLCARYRTRATLGNLNNHIGVPLTLLSLEESDEYAVIEMGMNHPGELAPLVKMTSPKIGVISNIGLAHLENFQDQQGIAQEKTEMIAHLPADGVAILNSDDEWSRRLAHRTEAEVVWVGEGAEWFADEVVIDKDGLSFRLYHGCDSILVSLPVINRVMVQNALLAAAVGHECGLSLKEIAQGLAEVKLPGARMNVQKFGGVVVINDAYNANPDSMRSALISLKDYPGSQRRCAVLGSMGELGSRAEELHYETGRYAVEQNLDFLITVGPHAESLAAGARQAGLLEKYIVVVETVQKASEVLFSWVQSGDVVLLKGSHFMGLEKIVELWKQQKTGN